MNEGKALSVLDHGIVKLIQHYGDDAMVCRAARVSVDGGVREGESSEKRDRALVKFLAEHLHTTPFEHSGATFYIKAPLFVFRQWHRHRTHSYNELSGRYSTTFNQFYLPPVERLLAEESQDNRQGEGRVETPAQAEEAREVIQGHCEEALARYHRLLELGVSRELARSVLPVNTYSEMYDTANLWNWTRFLKLRLAPDAQKEIRLYAGAIYRELLRVFPNSMLAFAGPEGWAQPES